MADNFKYAQLQSFTLAGAGAVTGATSITLSSMTDIDGNALSMSSTFGSIGYGTLEPNSGDQEEQISFTGLTNNANGTVTLTGISNVSFVYPYTETSGLAKTHPGGVTFVISNTSGFYNKLTSKNDDETIAGLWDFPSGANNPTIGNATYVAPTGDTQIATKKYVDDVAIAGAPKATDSVYGITRLSVAAASALAPIAVGDNDPRVPTQSENDALAGTSGSPSSTNKYVTNDDTATAATASKVARRLASGDITVPATPTNSTDAGSKSYIDAGDAAVTALIPSQNYYPNTLGTFGTYFTQTSRIDADLGWTVTGTPFLGGNWLGVSNATTTKASIPLGGRPTSATNAVQWNSGIDFRVAYTFKTDFLSAGTTPAGAGDIWYFHGFAISSDGANTLADITDTSRRAGFACYDGRIYAVTANGTNVESTDIQADAIDTLRHHLIDFTSTQVRYYINGTLVATHTTRVPNDANDMGLNFCGYYGSGSNPDFGMSGSVIISETLS